MMVDDHNNEFSSPVSTPRADLTNVDNATLRSIADAYLDAALSGNRFEALRVIREDGLSSGISVIQLYLGVIQDSQYRIGQMWEEGKITVSQEHLATGISQLAIAQLYSMMPRTTPFGMKVVIACVPGETHDMGARILADFFEMAGFDVRYLGADVPVGDIVNAVERFEPSLIALSATMTYNLPAFQETVAALRDEFGDDVLIAAGGQAFQLTPELLDELQIPIHAVDARELIEKSRNALDIN
jgi:MerR family transcriptional regulator, light-induced transcriptional regulator